MDFISQHTPNKKVHTTENDQEANASNLMNLTAQEDISEVQLEGGGRALTEFGRSVDPIQTMGQILPVRLLPSPPGFKMLFCTSNDYIH